MKMNIQMQLRMHVRWWVKLLLFILMCLAKCGIRLEQNGRCTVLLVRIIARGIYSPPE